MSWVRREVSVMVLAALFFAAVGPFGMFALPFGQRLTNWLLFAVAGYLCFRPIIAGAKALSEQAGRRRAIAIAIACVIAAVPATLLVAWVITGSRWGMLSAGELASLYPKVLLLGGAITAVQHVRLSHVQGRVPQRETVAVSAVHDPVADRRDASVEASRFLDRIPPALGRGILYLENEDHYIRVHTDHGSALILMRMRDAVAELAALDGAQVHRSWWVARNAVRDVVRRDRAILLRLIDGREVPVARSMAPALKQAGWFD